MIALKYLATFRYKFSYTVKAYTNCILSCRPNISVRINLFKS
uniref:Uncharacterized protein n=1 Tax=Myoviridae sp. ctJ2i1 TaxID=2825079 RepID=A0A8S5V1G0_9CAUD|nr:MAG TPA: hypothetical protein [Myoviridae sp. ctJ2i1]